MSQKKRRVRDQSQKAMHKKAKGEEEEENDQQRGSQRSFGFRPELYHNFYSQNTPASKTNITTRTTMCLAGKSDSLVNTRKRQGQFRSIKVPCDETEGQLEIIESIAAGWSVVVLCVILTVWNGVSGQLLLEIDPCKLVHFRLSFTVCSGK